jgi:hypothetical protein
MDKTQPPDIEKFFENLKIGALLKTVNITDEYIELRDQPSSSGASDFIENTKDSRVLVLRKAMREIDVGMSFHRIFYVGVLVCDPNEFIRIGWVRLSDFYEGKSYAIHFKAE